MKNIIALILTFLFTTGVSSGQIPASVSAENLKQNKNLQYKQKMFTKETESV